MEDLFYPKESLKKSSVNGPTTKAIPPPLPFLLVGPLTEELFLRLPSCIMYYLHSKQGEIVIGIDKGALYKKVSIFVFSLSRGAGREGTCCFNFDHATRKFANMPVINFIFMRTGGEVEGGGVGYN